MRAFFLLGNHESDGAVCDDLFYVVLVDFSVEFEVELVLVLFGACKLY